MSAYVAHDKAGKGHAQTETARPLSRCRRLGRGGGSAAAPGVPGVRGVPPRGDPGERSPPGEAAAFPTAGAASAPPSCFRSQSQALDVTRMPMSATGCLYLRPGRGCAALSARIWAAWGRRRGARGGVACRAAGGEKARDGWGCGLQTRRGSGAHRTQQTQASATSR